MNKGYEVNDNSNEFVINSIKNISMQLNDLKSIYQKNNISDLDKTNSEDIKNIQSSITKVVNDIDNNNQEHKSSIYQSIQDVKDNDTLVISEKKDKVYLPYTVNELNEYIKEYPNEYKSLSDVINQEYIVSLSKFSNQITSRFRETYYLMRDIEMKSIIESFRKAVEVMFNSKLNPAIISACKSEEQLDNYIHYSERGNLDEFKDFKIVFDFAPFENKHSGVYEDFVINSSRTSPRRNRGKHY